MTGIVPGRSDSQAPRAFFYVAGPTVPVASYWSVGSVCTAPLGGTPGVMPTSRPRYQITETPDVARALDAAAKRWPGESRSKLLLRLVHAGEQELAKAEDERALRRRRAIELTSDKYAEAFSDDYLSKLGQDWPG